MSAPLLGTDSAAKAIGRVKYTHDAMIDFIIANPSAKQKVIAAYFGFSETWISRVFNSDAFQARLAERKGDLVDPSIVATLDDKFKGLAHQSLEILAEKLEASRNPDLAFKTLELSAKAMGYGARKENVGVQNNFVVQLPGKAATAAGWAAAHNPRLQQVEEVRHAPVEELGLTKGSPLEGLITVVEAKDE